jgi:hypothetical protein
VQDDGCRARVFQSLDVIHFLRQRRRRWHEGIFQFEPEVFGGQVSHINLLFKVSKFKVQS